MQLGIGGKGGTHVREENTWNTSTRMLALLVALGPIVSAVKTSLMASHRVLMSLDTSVLSMAIGSKSNILLANLVLSSLPSEREIGG